MRMQTHKLFLIIVEMLPLGSGPAQLQQLAPFITQFHVLLLLIKNYFPLSLPNRNNDDDDDGRDGKDDDDDNYVDDNVDYYYYYYY